MNISIIGTRGIPANYGGFETFAEELSFGLQQKYHHHMTVVCHVDKHHENQGRDSHKGVRLLYSRFSKDRNPLLFYLDSIIIACKSSDIIYCCGPGGGLFGIIPSLSGKKLVINPDGLNWKRSKWPTAVQNAFRILEYLSVKFGNHLVCDSKAIARYMIHRYGGRNLTTIEYGAYLNKFSDVNGEEAREKLSNYGISTFEYHLVVARLEPENNIEMILEGYAMERRKHQLVIVGNAKNRLYANKLKNMLPRGVLFAGGIYDKDVLSLIRAKAVTYLHGHSVGGTNPSLLEALASGNICMCHDNEFNREVGSDSCLYFGSSRELSDLLERVENDPAAFSELRRKAVDRIRSRYNWDLIIDKYDKLFRLIGREGNDGSIA